MRVAPTEGYAGLKGHTLVVPGTGGLAQLGELCTDALVTTFELRRVALVHTRHVLPVAMASAWAAPGAKDGASALTTAAELYQAEGFPRITVLQLRAPVVEGKRSALAQEIWDWACAEGAAQLVVVSACSSHVKGDADLAASTDLRYVRVGAAAEDLKLGADVLPLGHGLPKEEQEEQGGASSIEAAKLLLRSGGLAKPLLLAASSAAGAADRPGAVGLLGLTSEVMSWQLLDQLARAACSCLSGGGEAPRLRAPPSWQYHMEMTATPQQLWL